MKTGERVIEQSSALDLLHAKYPGWRVFDTPDLPGDCNEEIHRGERLILVKTEGGCWAREWATAHAVAHLDLEHLGSPFTVQQEAEADTLAGIWLDVEWCEIPVDGDPTVRMDGLA